MRNIQLFPYERNQYFFGKLLTVNDFETEQKYFNDKRRLINRMMFGTGVAAGLTAMKVDNNTIVVESGMAYDGAGREIVVSEAVLKKLSMIDGFSDSKEDIYPYVYLCIEYDELKSEPVHSIMDSVLRDEAYNKFTETYRLYLTTDEPKKEEYGGIDLYYKDVQVVLEGNGIRVKHICPKYVESGNEFDLVVEIEKINQSLEIKLEYDLELLCFSSPSADGGEKIVFNESEEPVQKRVYTKKYRLKAANVGDSIGTISVKGNTMKLTSVSAGDIVKDLEANSVSTLNIVKGGIKDRFIDDFYKQSLEHIMNEKLQEKLYLAKIYLVRWGDSYEIGEVEKVPFNQYVTNADTNRILLEMCMDRINELEGRTGDGEASRAPGKHSNYDNPVRSGVVSIDLGDDPREGQVFYSPDIPHGFGIGEVHIVLGRTDTSKDDEQYIFGDASIFSSSGDVSAATAAQVNTKTGMFKIGLKLLKNTEATKVDVTWLAVKNYGNAKTYTDSKQVYVRPNIKYVGVRETVWFEAVVEGLKDKNVIWTVKEPKGGFIDKRGLYTAPNVPGVYEIVASSAADPKISGSAFVAVKKV